VRDPCGRPTRARRRTAGPDPLPGVSDPAITRNRVDLPAPFGPTSAIRSPAPSDRSSPLRIGRGPNATETPDRARIGSRSQLVSGPRPVQESRKNGAPTRAMTTPTGTSPTIRATTSAAASSVAPTRIESGITRRALGPTTSRTTCGTTRPTNRSTR
jgi:hypothetical protein